MYDQLWCSWPSLTPFPSQVSRRDIPPILMPHPLLLLASPPQASTWLHPPFQLHALLLHTPVLPPPLTYLLTANLRSAAMKFFNARQTVFYPKLILERNRMVFTKFPHLPAQNTAQSNTERSTLKLGRARSSETRDVPGKISNWQCKQGGGGCDR